MTDWEWTYRVRGTLTDAEQEIAENGVRLLLEGKLTAYSIGWRAKNEGGSTMVDCESQKEAIEAAQRMYGQSALKAGGKLFVRESASPAGRHNWLHPAGLDKSIELHPDLVEIEQVWSFADGGPEIELDPEQKELAL